MSWNAVRHFRGGRGTAWWPRAPEVVRRPPKTARHPLRQGSAGRQPTRKDHPRSVGGPGENARPAARPQQVKAAPPPRSSSRTRSRSSFFGPASMPSPRSSAQSSGAPRDLPHGHRDRARDRPVREPGRRRTNRHPSRPPPTAQARHRPTVRVRPQPPASCTHRARHPAVDGPSYRQECCAMDGYEASRPGRRASRPPS